MSPVELCLAGRISPQIALARLVLGGSSTEAIAALLAPYAGEPQAAALLGTFRRHRGDLARVAATFAGIGLDHGEGGAPEAVVARLRKAYDLAVSRSPEASVASYSLGDGATLAAATAELLGWLREAGLLSAEGDVLDIGCGFGRVAVAVAPHVRSVLGLDVSPGMVAEARRRAGDAAVRFLVTDGLDLDDVSAAGFDLVLAVDSFPYLVQAGGGVAARHVAGAARALRPGGAFAIFNFSYRGDEQADRTDAATWARAAGLTVERAAETPFQLWDGTAWLLRRAA